MSSCPAPATFAVTFEAGDGADQWVAVVDELPEIRATARTRSAAFTACVYRLAVHLDVPVAHLDVRARDL